jgi:hypothetical protein
MKINIFIVNAFVGESIVVFFVVILNFFMFIILQGLTENENSVICRAAK